MKLINKFGKGSKRELMGVHPDLIIVTTTALVICGDKGIDFSVFDGMRNMLEQRQYVDSGVSWTMDSQHLEQQDGWGHAVDLYPFILGKMRPEAINELIIIGQSMKEASKRHGVPITWGALKKYGGDWTNHNDMYHFELRQSVYNK